MCLKCPPPACIHDLRWSGQYQWCSGQSRNKFASNVFAYHPCHESLFHASFTVWHPYVNYRHMMTLVHFDEAVIHLMWFSLEVSRCNVTFSTFWLLQGSVATLMRWGGWSSYCRMCRSFLNLTLKTALKSVYFWQSNRPEFYETLAKFLRLCHRNNVYSVCAKRINCCHTHFAQKWHSLCDLYLVTPSSAWRNLFACNELDQRVIDTAVKQWRTRVHACIKAKGGYFEHSLP